MDAEFWSQHIAAAHRESLSVSAYARKHGLAVSTLYYWQRKLAACAPQPSNSRATFVALRVSASSQTPPMTCTLILDSDVHLALSALPPAEWLAQLTHAMQAR